MAERTRICTEDMEEKTRRRKDDSNSDNSGKVTLKKEIGLLSACAIIIGM